jgi:enterochelin esterase family protein
VTRSLAIALPLVCSTVLAGCSGEPANSDAPPPVAVAGTSALAGGSGSAGTGGTPLTSGGTSSGAGAGGSAGAALLGSGGTAGTSVAGSGGVGGAEPISPHADPGSEGDGIFSLSPPYKAATEYQRTDGTPQGKILRFELATSAIFPGAHDRDVAVYVPAQYASGTDAAVMVFQDGTNFFGFDGSIPTVLDNLIEQGKIPPLVGVFVSNGGGDYIGSQRGLEYDTVSGLYAEWADKELFPRVEEETKKQLPAQAVTITKDPEGRATMGGSSGGAASFSMAWWRADLFRKVIAFSGTFVAQVPANSPFPHGAWIYHDVDPYGDTPTGLIAASCEKIAGPKTTSAVEPCDTPLSKSACEAVSGCGWNTDKNKPIRVWLQAGDNDLGAGGNPSTYRNFHLANQRMAAALEARGYHFHFDDCDDAGHVDQGPLKQTLPTALTWLWRGYNQNLTQVRL